MTHTDIMAAVVIWLILAVIFAAVATALLHMGDRED